MAQITRRQLLKSGAGGAAALAALAVAPVAAVASTSRKNGIAVHAHGVVRNPGGFNLAISLDVAGRADSLAGAGWDSGSDQTSPTMVPGSVIGACYYTAFGSLRNDVVTLDGKSLFTNRALTASPEEATPRSDTRSDGRSFHGRLNLENGRISWSLDPGNPAALFTGTGVVVLIDQD